MKIFQKIVLYVPHSCVYVCVCLCEYVYMKEKNRTKSPTPTSIKEAVNIHKREKK